MADADNIASPLGEVSQSLLQHAGRSVSVALAPAAETSIHEKALDKSSDVHADEQGAVRRARSRKLTKKLTLKAAVPGFRGGIVGDYLLSDVKQQRQRVPLQHCKGLQKLGSIGSSNVNSGGDAESVGNSDTDDETSIQSTLSEAVRIALREKLTAALHDELVSFWHGSAKICSLPPSDATGMLIGRFRNKAWEIAESHRAGKCLEAEINMMLLRFRLAEAADVPAHIRRREEEADGRKDRENDFWRLFHMDDDKIRFAGQTRNVSQAPRAPERDTLRVASSMVQTSGKFWTPARDSKLPDAKLVRGPVPQRTVNEAPLGGRLSSTRKVIEHRSSVHNRRKHKASSLSSSQSCPLLLDDRLPSYSFGNTRNLDSSYDEPDEELEMERVGPGDEFSQSRGAFFDVGEFMDSRTRWSRRKIGSLSKIPRSSQKNNELKLPALHRAPPRAGSGMLVQQSSSDGKLPEVGVEGLLPVVSVPSAFDKTPLQNPYLPKETFDSAAARYVRICHATGVLPTPAVLTMTEARKIYSHSRNLVDDDLCAIASMIRSLDYLHEVDLSGHALLSNRALMPFLQKLFGRPAAGFLKKLDLEGCRGVARGAMEIVVSLLDASDGVYNLESLNLGGMPLPAACQLPMCDAIANHPQIRSVLLANTGFGQHPAAATSLTKLLAAIKLEELDLGWNSFDRDFYEAFSRQLMKPCKLKKLYLASCASSAASNGEAPIAWLLEGLAWNRSLKSLDISMNGIDFRGALVLEDALDCHKGLTDLIISQNPLGVGGMRSFLRLLSRESSGLRHFTCSQCMGPSVEQSDTIERCFNATDPSGRYVLDLSRTYSRALLRMLYKTCERFALPPDHAFMDVEYTSGPPAPSCPSPPAAAKSAKPAGKKTPKAKAKAKTAAAKAKPPQGPSKKDIAYKHPLTRDNFGAWVVPTTGYLSTTFSISEAISKLDVTAVEGFRSQKKEQRVSWLHQDAIVRDKSLLPTTAQYMERYLALVKFTPSFAKVAPLLAQWESLKNNPKEQGTLLDALSSDFLLKFATVRQLCSERTRAGEVLPKLLHCITGGPVQFYLALTIPRQLHDYLMVYNKSKALLLFNIENPTGTYTFDLGNASEYAVTQTIVLLDTWESVTTRKKGCADQSKYGNWSNIRNCIYQNAEIKSVPDWHLPSHDSVRLDFASWRRPPQGALPLADDKWDRLLRMLYASSSSHGSILMALRKVSNQFFVKAVHLRELMNFFPKSSEQADVVVMFLSRLQDVQNLKLIRGRLCPAVQQSLRERLGVLGMFPYFQPEQFFFSFDLSLYEDRVGASVALHLAFRERAANIQNPTLLQEDGTYYAFAAGVPPTWEKLEALPPSGTLSFNYICSADDRKMQMRRELAKKYGGWNVEDDVVKAVLWWSRLDAVPTPVRSFLYYCMVDFRDAFAAFKDIDGPGGNGEISLIEIKEAVARWGWGKFKKNSDWVKQVFRYLDPDNGGQISLAEWDTMQQLFKELQLTMLEFLQFVDRQFGDFDLAWSEMDTDGSDSVDADEWVGAVKSCGFYGASEPIFAYLTNDLTEDRKQDGSADKCSSLCITRLGWQKLRDVWEDRDSIRRKILTVDSLASA